MNKRIFWLSVLILNIIFITNVKASDVSVDYNDNILSYRLTDKYIHTGRLGYVHVGTLPAYGLDPLNGFGEDYYVNNSFFDNFSQEDLNYFKLVSYYGYSSERNDLSYYMAAQALIWSRITGRDVYWTDLDDNVINIDNYKNEIVNNINKHYLTPSFSNQNINGDMGEIVELLDTNNVLSEYDIEYSGENEIWKENNKLYIKIKSRKKENLYLVKKINNEIADTAYVTDKGQDVGVFGINEVINSSLAITPNNPGSQIKVIFNNEEYKELSFKIKDINKNTYFNYKGEEIFTIKDEIYMSEFYLDEGDYEIELIDVPNNYIIDIENKNFKVDSKNSVIDFDIKLTKIKGKVTINRLFNGIDLHNKNNYVDYKLPNAIYYLYAKEDIFDKDGNIIYLKDQLVDTFKSDINGQATSKDIEVGNYYIVEELSNHEYSYKDKIDFSITIDDNSSKLINKELKIKTSYNNLSLELDISSDLKDYYQEENLYNIEYGLYSKDDILFMDKILFSKGELIKTFTTNKNGMIKENLLLPYGNYFIRKLSEQVNNNFIDYIFEYNGQNQINSFEIEKSQFINKKDDDSLNNVQKEFNKIESDTVSIVPEIEVTKSNFDESDLGIAPPTTKDNLLNNSDTISDNKTLPNTSNKYFKYYAISIILIVVGVIGLKYKKV